MAMSSFAFRNARAADSERIAALHADSWRFAYRSLLPGSYLADAIDAERAELWRKRMAGANERQYVLLDEREGVLTGFVCVLLDEEPAWGAYLDNLHIRPTQTGHGLGGQLFGHAARWVAAAEPGWPMRLWVFEGNERARRFYERYGGTAVERAVKAMPGGASPVALRYLWRNLRPLLADRHGEPATAS